MSVKIVVGVDIGGTSIKVGICNIEGELLHTYEGPTEVEKGSDTVCDNIAAYARLIVEQSSYDWAQVEGVGIGIAGFLDIKRGFVHKSVNLFFENVPLKDILEEKLGKKVLVNNDANVAALGEAWAGAGRGISDCVCYTLGTGVGGGVSKAGEFLFEQIREVFHKSTPDMAQEGVEIVPAILGNDAGVVGAAGLIIRS